MTENEVDDYLVNLYDKQKRGALPKLSDEDFADFHRITMFRLIDDVIETQDKSRFKSLQELMHKSGNVGVVGDTTSLKYAAIAIREYFQLRFDELNQ